MFAPAWITPLQRPRKASGSSFAALPKNFFSLASNPFPGEIKLRLTPAAPLEQRIVAAKLHKYSILRRALTQKLISLLALRLNGLYEAAIKPNHRLMKLAQLPFHAEPIL